MCFFDLYCWIVFHCLEIPILVYLFNRWTSDLFLFFLNFMSNSAKIIPVNILVWTYVLIFSGWILKMELLCCIVNVCVFLETVKLSFPKWLLHFSVLTCKIWRFQGYWVVEITWRTSPHQLPQLAARHVHDYLRPCSISQYIRGLHLCEQVEHKPSKLSSVQLRVSWVNICI